MEGKNQETAGAMAGMSVRSARHWQSGPLPSERKTEHWWRTRPDPFDGVWEGEIEPLLRGEAAGGLKATTIIEWLEERHPGRFSASQLRTLQRRLQDWRALQGPDREVYFPQEHPPGREAQVDFTHCNSLGVTIGGRPYRHLLFHFVLCYSGWRYAEAASGETFLALKQGLQGALWALGGAPVFMAHALMENRNGLLVDFLVSDATGTAERDAVPVLLDEARERGFHPQTLGADKGYDTRGCVGAMRARRVAPHVAQHTSGRSSAIDGRTTRHRGYALSQRLRKRVEEIFGWMKTVGGFRRTRYRGLDRTGLAGYLVGTAYNLVRMARLMTAETPAPQAAQAA